MVRSNNFRFMLLKTLCASSACSASLGCSCWCVLIVGHLNTNHRRDAEHAEEAQRKTELGFISDPGGRNKAHRRLSQYFATVGSTSLDQPIIPPLRFRSFPVNPERCNASIARALLPPILQCTT